MARIRVVIADDHRAMLEATKSLLEPEFEVVGTVGDGLSLILAAESIRPDVIIVDITMPVLGGIEAASRILKENSEVKIIFFTIHKDLALVKEAFSMGAHGYVTKTGAVNELFLAIREAMEGNFYSSIAINH